eukprot:TRINITY_DN70371_c0_g1_i1.p1 TRINITY_DN70371_c0_g1~~TRINITY_DN70371_c0_g1_i1.p1  ORF type:complete len:136 (-),score=13.23 TRINITY_DN70371_c0_g1_i1:111-518(-)
MNLRHVWSPCSESVKTSGRNPKMEDSIDEGVEWKFDGLLNNTEHQTCQRHSDMTQKVEAILDELDSTKADLKQTHASDVQTLSTRLEGADMRNLKTNQQRIETWTSTECNTAKLEPSQSSQHRHIHPQRWSARGL